MQKARRYPEQVSGVALPQQLVASCTHMNLPSVAVYHGHVQSGGYERAKKRKNRLPVKYRGIAEDPCSPDRIRLGSGEYSDYWGRPAALARKIFFERLDAIAPEVGESLCRDCLDPFLDLWKELQNTIILAFTDLPDPDAPFAHLPEADRPTELAELSPSAVEALGITEKRIEEMREYEAEQRKKALRTAPLRNALLSWADRWHLRTNWALDAATTALYCYGGVPGFGQTAGILALTPLSGGEDFQPYSQEHFRAARLAQEQHAITHGSSYPFTVVMGWNLTKETEGEFKERVSHALDIYCIQRRALAEEVDLTAVPRKRTANHIDMLIRWQVQQWTKSRIASEYHRSPKAVDDAVARAADLIGLSLRKGKPGRPPGKTSPVSEGS